MDKENKLILYKDDEGKVNVNVRFADEDVWLTRENLAEIYATTPQNISIHVGNIYQDQELNEEGTRKKFFLVRQEGKRQVQREIDHYNLDMIIALGYRVQSPIAVRFRRWATQRLHEYIQKKLRENGSPKAIIETDESRSYFLIDIPCRKDFVQDKGNAKPYDIQYVVTQILSACPRYVQDMSKMEIENLAMCMIRSETAISAQNMLDGIDSVSYKQKRRKYLDKLLSMGLLLMTFPDKPTSRNQQYVLSDKGKIIIGRK